MSKVRSRNSWIGGGSQMRAPAKMTNSARHISRAKPDFRATHRRRIWRRFMSIGLPALHHAVRIDHAAPARDWLFPGCAGIMDFLPGSRCPAIVGRRAARQRHAASGDVEDEIAGLETCGHVL